MFFRKYSLKKETRKLRAEFSKKWEEEDIRLEEIYERKTYQADKLMEKEKEKWSLRKKKLSIEYEAKWQKRNRAFIRDYKDMKLRQHEFDFSKTEQIKTDSAQQVLKERVEILEGANKRLKALLVEKEIRTESEDGKLHNIKKI